MNDDDAIYTRILEAHDDPRNLEMPAEFDYPAAQRRCLRFAEELQRAFGVQCRIDTQIQDASFHGQIGLPPDQFNDPSRLTQGAVIRLSNFGRMATVADESALKPELMARIQELLTQFGYVYIPWRVLARPYPGDGWIRTWGIRYFDCL